MPDSDFDHAAIAKAINANKPELMSAIRRDVSGMLMGLSPSDALTLRLVSGETEIRTIAPTVSKEYAIALINFCRGQSLYGYQLDSSVTPRVTAVVESTFLTFFGSDVLSQKIAEAVLAELNRMAATVSVVKHEISDEKKWLQTELKTLANLDIAHSLAGDLVDLSAHQLQEFLASSLGKQMMAAIAKVLATSTGKILVLQTLKVVVAKVMASIALRTALLSTIRKVGVAILIKTAIGKALLALLAVVGLAHVPAVWIVLPILAGFLVYEYNTFPEKLAKRIPNEVLGIVDAKFGNIADEIARSLTSAILAEFVSMLTNVKFDGNEP